MRLDAVMDEVAEVLARITGLNVFAYPPPTLSTPAGYVSYPREIQFDEAYGRGSDVLEDLPVTLLAGEATARPTRDVVAAWASGDGAASLKKHLDEHAWVSCDHVQLGTAEFDVETIGGVAYLAVIFKCHVEGPGGD
jgi:hypothetical protein